MIRELGAVALGGALGSVGRYLLCYVSLAGHNLFGFPLGTLIVNTVGSLIIGLVMRVCDSQTAILLLAVGFCGGFTTFSSFSVDALRLLREGAYPAATLYIGITLVICITFAALGMWIGDFIKN